MCTRWVPKYLSDEQKATNMLPRLQRGGDKARGNRGRDIGFITIRNANLQAWSKNDYPPLKIIQITPPATKVIATVFCDRNCIILVDFLEDRRTISAAQKPKHFFFSLAIPLSVMRELSGQHISTKQNVCTVRYQCCQMSDFFKN